MPVGDAHKFLDFLTPVLTQLSFQSPQLLSSHALEVRGKYAGKKVCLNRVSNSQPRGHESDMFTTEPFGRGKLLVTEGVFDNVVFYQRHKPDHLKHIYLSSDIAFHLDQSVIISS